MKNEDAQNFCNKLEQISNMIEVGQPKMQQNEIYQNNVNEEQEDFQKMGITELYEKIGME